MSGAGTVLDATLWVQARQWFDRDASGEMPEALRWSAAVVRAANRLGVMISAGTDDIGNPNTDPLPNLHRELELLVTYAGLSPLEAITAATRNAARAIGIQSTHGTLQTGMAADLVILNRNPVEDIQNTRSIHAVMKNGKLIDGSAE